MRSARECLSTVISHSARSCSANAVSEANSSYTELHSRASATSETISSTYIKREPYTIYDDVIARHAIHHLDRTSSPKSSPGRSNQYSSPITSTCSTTTSFLIRFTSTPDVALNSSRSTFRRESTDPLR